MDYGDAKYRNNGILEWWNIGIMGIMAGRIRLFLFTYVIYTWRIHFFYEETKAKQI
jgi:hypothetical protein